MSTSTGIHTHHNCAGIGIIDCCIRRQTCILTDGNNCFTFCFSVITYSNCILCGTGLITYSYTTIT